MITIIEDQEVQTLVNRAEAFEAIEQCYRAAASGRATVSHPSALSLASLSGAKATFKTKGAILDDLNVAGFRLVADSNVLGGDGSSYVYLISLDGAAPFAFVGENWLHRLRTATTALVACRLLAPANPSALTLIGTGRIAEEFVRIVGSRFPGLPIILGSRSAERARTTAEKWRGLTQNPISAADSVPQAVAAADIVVTLSDADDRLFAASDLRPGALVCALGGQHEFDADVLEAADRFVVDEIDFVCTTGNGAHWIESGQITRDRLEQRVDATLGEVLLGRKQIASEGIVLAIVQGMAVCDIALAKLAYDRKTGSDR
jgi:ornithine cyclodeaminase/alanine dehydrogenase-like protein (mu-crystallin family)